MTTTNENPARIIASLITHGCSLTIGEKVLESEARELQTSILSDRDTLAALATDIDEFRNGYRNQPPAHRKGERLVNLAVEIAMNERALSVLLEKLRELAG